MLKRRWEWFAGQLDLDPEKLIFIDETGASTNLARKGGRCRRGRRLRASVPHGHYKTVTLVAGVRLRGLEAQKVFDRPINAALFEEWVETCLVPTLSKGDVVVMDNLPAHKGPRVEKLIKAVGAELRYLPPYSPDMNPIEKAFSKLKAYLRKIAERTVAGLMRAPLSLRRYLQTRRMHKLFCGLWLRYKMTQCGLSGSEAPIHKSKISRQSVI